MEKLLRWKNYPKNNFVKKISLIENYYGRRKCGKIKKRICSNYLAMTRLFNIVQFPILFYFLMTECSKNKISFTWILPCFRQFCDMTLSWVFDLTNYLFFPMTKYSNNNSILLLPVLLFYLFPATFRNACKEWTPRERWIDSLWLHVEANSAESFNFLCKWGRETGPFLFLSLPSIPFADTPWVAKYPVLSASRGNARPVLIKTLNRKCGLRGEVVVDDTSSSRSNRTSGTFGINRFYVCIINLVNSWKLYSY